jgi:hypothetical protein
MGEAAEVFVFRLCHTQLVQGGAVAPAKGESRTGRRRQGHRARSEGVVFVVN